MKRGFAVWAVVMVALFLAAGVAWARIGDRVRQETGVSAGESGGGGDDYSAADQASDDKDLDADDLARICFVKKTDKGDMVFIRIPPGMYRFAMARAKAKRHGVVRVLLRPRHHLAIEHATGKLPKRVMLRLSAKRFEQVSGLKGHYVVRPLSQFMRGDDCSDSDDGRDED